MNRRWFASALLGFVCIVAPALALATTYGNLTRKHGAGRLEVGLMASQTTREFDNKLIAHTSVGNATVPDSGDLDVTQQGVFLRYGISDSAAIGLVTGNVEYKDEFDDKLSGQETGGMFWTQFGSGGDGFEGGLLVGYRKGTVSNRYWRGESKQMDIALGGAKSMSDQSAVFFNLVYSKRDISLDASGPLKQALEDELSVEFGVPVSVSKFGQEFTPTQPLILALGFEVTPSPNVAFSMELHAMGETGFALGVAAGF